MEVLRSNTVDGPEVPSTWVEFVLKKIQCWQRLQLDKGKLNVRKYDCRFSGRQMGERCHSVRFGQTFPRPSGALTGGRLGFEVVKASHRPPLQDQCRIFDEESASDSVWEVRMTK